MCIFSCIDCVCTGMGELWHNATRSKHTGLYRRSNSRKHYCGCWVHSSASQSRSKRLCSLQSRADSQYYSRRLLPNTGRLSLLFALVPVIYSPVWRVCSLHMYRHRILYNIVDISFGHLSAILKSLLLLFKPGARFRLVSFLSVVHSLTCRVLIVIISSSGSAP